MEVVANNYLPGDQRLVDKIVYELKAQGIFDQFRKECFADVDTKPAYQNLRQRVEGSVSGFLKEQSWRPDMNKNQVREMLRKTITESGFLETGVERIVDQVVNPKINTVFLPKVEEVVYSYLGIKRPNKNEASKSECDDLLPHDLEAVSPESEPVDKKDDKSSDHLHDLEESKTEEDESPPFEPLEEQSEYVPHEENSVDSHLSGFSGLVSHESNQSNENKVTPMEQDSQMSRNSSDSRLSIVTSDENTKTEISEEIQTKLAKSSESISKDNKPKLSDKHKSHSNNSKEKDKKNNKDSKSRHGSSSKDKDKNRDRKDSKSSSKNEKDRSKDKNDKDRTKSTNKYSSHSSNSSSSSSSKDKSVKKEPSRSEKDKDKNRSAHKDSKPRDKSKEKPSDKHKHSSSSHKKEKEKKRDKPKDDHYSSRDKKNDRRSTDRDSNDGQSNKPNFSSNNENHHTSESQKTNQNSESVDSNNSDHTTTRAPIVITGVVEASEVTISSPDTQRVKVFKPKCASNMQEALRLRKIRKQLAKLEKQNQLSLTSVDVNSPILMSSSIDLDDLKLNEKSKQETANNQIVAQLEEVPVPLQNTIISQDNWDAMEAKLRAEVCSEFKGYTDDESIEEIENVQDCKYFDSVDIKQIEFLVFVERFIKNAEKKKKRTLKRKLLEDNDLKNNNKHLIPEKKTRIARKNNNHAEVSVNDKFSLPLSPAESEKSIGKKEETVTPLKPKRNTVTKTNNQRYSSDDLYKPRPTFASSRRRGAKNLEN